MSPRVPPGYHLLHERSAGFGPNHVLVVSRSRSDIDIWQCATMCYMQRVGIRDLRQNASAVLRRVAAGEVVEVTDRGRAVARIVPMHEASRLEQLVAEGRASSATGDVLDVKAMPRIAGKPALSKILADMRADER